MNMERKNYLVEPLSKEEKSYLKKIIINTRKKYIRDNYNYINSTNVQLFSCADVEAESVLEEVLNKCEREIKSAMEFEKVMSSEKLYNVVKALSFEEKMVLFSLYKENKTTNQIAVEMKKDRTSIWRIRNKALNKIMRRLIGGE
jgi:DNA-directed RNA polymerase specialized sigma subunit